MGGYLFLSVPKDKDVLSKIPYNYSHVGFEERQYNVTEMVCHSALFLQFFSKTHSTEIGS